MKRRFFLTAVVILAVLMLAGCGSSGGTAKVENGMISLDKVTVDFGDNSVPDGESASLTETAAGEVEEANCSCSPLYALTLGEELGVPDKPVTVSIAVPEDYEAEDDSVLLLGVGVDCEYEDGSIAPEYFYIEAEVSDGIATASFDPYEVYEAPGTKRSEGTSGTPSRPVDGPVTFKCTLFSQRCYLENGGHFILYYPSKIDGEVFISHVGGMKPILADLESVYDLYKGKGYKYDESDFPMKVYIEKIKEDGAYYPTKKYIVLSTAWFTGKYAPGSMNKLTWHEFFHYAQVCYTHDPKGIEWIDESTASYYDSVAQNAKYGETYALYVSKAFSGPVPPKDSPQDGYARSPMIHFLTERLGGDEWIRKVYEGGGTEAAFLEQTGDPAKWFRDYYYYLVTSGGSDSPYIIYKQIIGQNDEYVPDVGQTVNIIVPSEEEQAQAKEDGEDVVLAQASVPMEGMGCRVLAVTVSEDDLKYLPDEGNVKVSCEGGQAVVLSLKGSKEENLGTSLKGLKTSVADKKFYIIIVTSDGALGTTGNVGVKITLSGMDIDGIDGFMGDWKDAEGRRVVFMRSGDYVLRKDPDLSWYAGDVCVYEYTAEYDEANFTLNLNGRTGWVEKPKTLYSVIDPRSRRLEINAASLKEQYVALKAEGGKVTEMMIGKNVYTR